MFSWKRGWSGGAAPLTFSFRKKKKKRQKDGRGYLRVKLASIVQECHADLLQPADLTGVVLKALKHATADVTCTHQAVLDLSWRREGQVSGGVGGGVGGQKGEGAVR